MSYALLVANISKLVFSTQLDCNPLPAFSYLPWFKIFYELLNRISDLKRANEVNLSKMRLVHYICICMSGIVYLVCICPRY